MASLTAHSSANIMAIIRIPMIIDHRRIGPNSGASPWNCSGPVLLPSEVVLAPVPEAVGSADPDSDADPLASAPEALAVVTGAVGVTDIWLTLIVIVVFASVTVITL